MAFHLLKGWNANTFCWTIKVANLFYTWDLKFIFWLDHLLFQKKTGVINYEGIPRVFHLPEPLGAIMALGQDASFGFHNRQLVAHPERRRNHRLLNTQCTLWKMLEKEQCSTEEMLHLHQSAKIWGWVQITPNRKSNCHHHDYDILLANSEWKPSFATILHLGHSRYQSLVGGWWCTRCWFLSSRTIF